jgi:hypothetical protein
MAFDLDRAVRRVERQTGALLEICHDAAGIPYALAAVDPELEGRLFARGLGTRSQWEKNLHALHSAIYAAKKERKYQDQGGLCAKCKKRLGQFGEANHIVHRSKGRSDVLANIEIVCPPYSGGCNWHRQEHGERVKA